MSERTDADKLANRLLDEPNADPDDDLRMLSRQLLRRNEAIDRLQKALADAHNPTLDMINANIEITLHKHQEAVALIRRAIERNRHALCAIDRVEDILNALSIFHPMHGEAWPGWPTLEGE